MKSSDVVSLAKQIQNSRGWDGLFTDADVIEIVEAAQQEMAERAILAYTELHGGMEYCYCEHRCAGRKCSYCTNLNEFKDLLYG